MPEASSMSISSRRARTSRLQPKPAGSLTGEDAGSSSNFSALSRPAAKAARSAESMRTPSPLVLNAKRLFFRERSSSLRCQVRSREAPFSVTSNTGSSSGLLS